MEKKSHVISCWATSPRGFSLQISNGNCSLRFWRGGPQPSRIFKSGTISSADGRWESNWNPIKSRDSLCLQFADALPQEQMLCQTQVIFAKKKRGYASPTWLAICHLEGLESASTAWLSAHPNDWHWLSNSSTVPKICKITWKEAQCHPVRLWGMWTNTWDIPK